MWKGTPHREAMWEDVERMQRQKGWCYRAVGTHRKSTFPGRQSHLIQVKKVPSEGLLSVLPKTELHRVCRAGEKKAVERILGKWERPTKATEDRCLLDSRNQQLTLKSRLGKVHSTISILKQLFPLQSETSKCILSCSKSVHLFSWDNEVVIWVSMSVLRMFFLYGISLPLLLHVANFSFCHRKRLRAQLLLEGHPECLPLPHPEHCSVSSRRSRLTRHVTCHLSLIQCFPGCISHSMSSKICSKMLFKTNSWCFIWGRNKALGVLFGKG